MPVERREYNWVKRPAPPQYLMQDQHQSQALAAAAVGAFPTTTARFFMVGTSLFPGSQYYLSGKTM